MKVIWGSLWAMALVLCGCQVSSKNEFKAGEFNGDKPYKNRDSALQLNESEVIGLPGKGEITDDLIRKTLDQAHTFQLKKGSSVLVAQSGMPVPDTAMVAELSPHFHVLPYTGLASEIMTGDQADGNLAKALRLAAARAGAETILVYWGNLEMKRDEMVTHAVSWVPVVNVVVPDEYQKLRMRLKMALIDVRSGNWGISRVEPIEEQALSTRFARDHTDSEPVKALKKETYVAAVKELLKSYTQ